MQFVLMAFSIEYGMARTILTGVIVATLSIMLWSAMIAVTSDGAEHRERVASLGFGFSAVLAVTASWMIAAAFAGLGGVAVTLFAVQVATLLSMLAAGGVEYAWEVRSLASAPEPGTDTLSERVSRQLAASSASLAAMHAAAREGEPV
ncbi:MAG: hypothetical protein Kow0026_09450 [Oricola sp.]